MKKLTLASHIWYNQTMRVCSVCRRRKPNDKFTAPDSAVCKECRNARTREKYASDLKFKQRVLAAQERWRREHPRKNAEQKSRWRHSTFKGYTNRKLSSIRRNARVRGHKVTITAAYLRRLFEEQGGRCPLTGRELAITSEYRNLDALSVDRIDGLLGYVIGNVRLITHQANCARSFGTDEQLLEFCKDVIKKASASTGA